MTNQTIASHHQSQAEVNKIIDDLTLFDDDLMTLVFNQNIPATELLLRIIMGRNIKVTNVMAQYEMRNPLVGGRNITLDILAIDENGEEIDIEVQGGTDGAHVRRARFHSSVIDTRMLMEGDKFSILKDSYVIFIYKHDKFRKGLPIYRAERIIQETREKFNDGSHIIYVNGNYKGNDEIGKLIQDFHAKSSAKMNFKELADGIHHYKETEEGRDVMCESVRKYAEEYSANKDVEKVQIVMEKLKYSVEEALDFLNITGEEKIYIIEKLQQ